MRSLLTIAKKPISLLIVSSSVLSVTGFTVVEHPSSFVTPVYNNHKNRNKVTKLHVTNEEINTSQSESESSNNEKWRRPELFGQSLVQQTVDEMENDSEYQETKQKLDTIGSIGMSKEERTKRRRALDSLGVPSFNEFLFSQQNEQIKSDDDDEDTSAISDSSGASNQIILDRKQTEILQLNVGLYCNQACAHCHVESSPLRTEMMSNEVAAKCIQLLKDTPSVHTLDITGGAPELNDNFRYIVSMAREISNDCGRKLDIIDRCNLTVLQEPGQEDLIPFLVKHKVHVIASLPCYSESNVDKQRGNGVFDRSISALITLNDAGYGKPDTGLHLDLVYNPSGAFLPPSQQDLEMKYKEVLMEEFGIEFNSLFTITNMPVKRFTDFLYRRKELKDYMDLLVKNYNGDTVENLMCRNTISVGYDGRVFDCDFNQQVCHQYDDFSGLLSFSNKHNSHEHCITFFSLVTQLVLTKTHLKEENQCLTSTAWMICQVIRSRMIIIALVVLQVWGLADRE